MVVLIPAYQPELRLAGLVDELLAADPATPVVVVDDGSGPAYEPVFAAAREAGAEVLTSPVNRGKGRALKTGFAHIATAHPGADVVCADGDGQHAVPDILRVAEHVACSRRTVLGARGFTGEVPLRSRLGNTATRAVVRLATGMRLQDTQTGLRGYPARLVGMLADVPGERYEYETALLVAAARRGEPVEEIPIRTIYLDGNASSHFRAVRDSARVYGPLLPLAATSFGSFLLDTAVLFAVQALTGVLLVSVLSARAVSSSVNFLANRYLVFPRARTSLGTSAVRYWALAATLLAANAALMAALTGLGLGLLAAKILTETGLFATSLGVQKRAVFPARVVPAPRGPDGQSQQAHSPLVGAAHRGPGAS